jgi:hypothetical protein
VQGLVAGKISITLPKDRTKPGTLVLKDPKGETLFSCPCLGRSSGHSTNLKRDPMKYRGNTPVGKFMLTSVDRLGYWHRGIGTLWVQLDPDDFYDTQARRAEIGGRRGFGIHGGRGNDILKVTHGCVRLLDRDMADFARVAGKMRFTVEIAEAA